MIKEENKSVSKWEKKKELRENFVRRAYEYLQHDKGARAKLAKNFGISVSKADVTSISLLFSIMGPEEFETEHIVGQDSETLEAYFFVLTMMAYYTKDDDKGEKRKSFVPVESKLRKLYWTGNESTKNRIQKLVGSRFGNGGVFQRELARITRYIDKSDMKDINYFKLLQDMCEWNTYGKKTCGTVSDACFSWTKEIFIGSSMYSEENEEIEEKL